jgi:hypothetical protein
MRPLNVKLFCCIGLLLSIAMVVGCGSSDGPLDEVGQRYTAIITIDDGFTEGDQAVDIAMDDCDMNATTNDDWEDFGPAIANVKIAVSSDAPGITLQSYSIQYIALPSPNSVTIETPTDLEDPLPGYFNIDIPSGGSASFSLTCMSVDTKTEYREEQGWTWYYDAGTGARFWIPPELEEGRYTIRFTFNYVNTEGHTGSIVRDATVWLGDFDDC